MKLEEVNTRTKEAVDFLVAALESGHSEVLTAYLGAMAKFHTYSFGNIMLIARQNEHGVALGRDVTLDQLRHDYDAVFLGAGLGATNKLDLPGEGKLANVIDAVDYIAELRQSPDLASLPVGRRVVVIGGGMTAVDAAVQSKRLGAESVTIVYRRGLDQMKASGYERELAQTSGVLIRTWARPVALEAHGDTASGVLFERTRDDDGKLVAAGGTFRVEADVVFTAIGQTPDPATLDGVGVKRERDGRIVVDAERRTTLAGVWAGGDCVAGGLALTVSAVEDGKQAARSIDAALKVKSCKLKS